MSIALEIIKLPGGNTDNYPIAPHYINSFAPESFKRFLKICHRFFKIQIYGLINQGNSPIK